MVGVADRRDRRRHRARFLWSLLCSALVLGVLLVLPIGGADMPVVISLLNSFTGLAAASTGFVLDNNVLIIGGTLVGASGTLLTILMGQAMNRSLAQRPVRRVRQAPAGAAAPARGRADGAVRSTRRGRRGHARVRAVGDRRPGLRHGGRAGAARGARAGRPARGRGVDVKYAIHPVAGRMPGHMNVLLAEANVPYRSCYEMEEINPEFARTDVALVIGANDVVNPAARTRPESPIYGMPILDVDKRRDVVVFKRIMNPGFAGIENELSHDPKTVMLFGDAKDSITRLIADVKLRPRPSAAVKRGRAAALFARGGDALAPAVGGLT